MSIESLLIVALLIVFPLLERLNRYLRTHAVQTPADPANARPRQRPPALPGLPTPEGATSQRSTLPEGAASAERAATLKSAATPERATIPERAAEASGAPGPAVRPVTVPPPVQLPPPEFVPPALPPRHRAPERLTASERVRAGRTIQAEQAALAPARGRSSRARHAVVLRGGRADLRRAVVLMTVLGPCKALETEAGHQRA